ncbi:unnamed protein product [Thelazia callipaeda]|uniref:t-SNARE coiled-coil homology domain-containing protein n=1 Tax=Thelazia callipaeda TaxID=103827 RepID=A0A0N5D961_THECL|nr:unnamed protein product [Thelazia callipaeda]
MVMAECLEENEEIDCDKKMDSLGYFREQFDRFIHDYRETNASSVSNVWESQTQLDATLKQDFINVERKLRKTFCTVQRLSSSEEVERLSLKVKSVLEIFKTIKKVQNDIRGEFSIHNVPLPLYDSTDIELLLGSDLISVHHVKAVELLTVKGEQREEIVENIKNARRLLMECEGFVQLFKKKGEFYRQFYQFAVNKTNLSFSLWKHEALEEYH